MAALYDFWRKPEKEPGKEPVEMTPRIVSQGTVNLQDMARNIHASSTFQPGEVEAVLNALTKELIDNLSEGKTVQLGQLGYFTLKLKSRKITDKSKIHAQSIFVDTIKFRPTIWLKERFNSIQLQRAREGFRHSVVSTPEQRRAMLEQYFQKHPFIDRKDYMYLTGRVKTSALTDLRSFVQEGYLIRYGKRLSPVYMKNPAYKL